jgi:hypothetical protein
VFQDHWTSNIQKFDMTTIIFLNNKRRSCRKFFIYPTIPTKTANLRETVPLIWKFLAYVFFTSNSYVLWKYSVKDNWLRDNPICCLYCRSHHFLSPFYSHSLIQQCYQEAEISAAKQKKDRKKICGATKIWKVLLIFSRKGRKEAKFYSK